MSRQMQDAELTRRRAVEARARQVHEAPRYLTVYAVEPTEVSQPFMQGMADRMAVSMYKYGPWCDNAGREDVHAQVELRWQCYLRTGNTEYLMDVANLAMMEFMRPQVEGAFYAPTTERQSPGIISVRGDRSHRGEEAPA